MGLLLALHVGLAVWGAARNSVTFDENFHLPAGVLAVAKGELRVSVVNPPLVKAMGGAVALALGARLPSEEALADGEQGVVGESFMRRNADHYHSLYFGARLVIVALSVVVALLVWLVARRGYGVRGGLLALGFWCLAPEALAHGGVFTMDMATTLGWLATVVAFWRFVRTGSGRWWAATAAAVAFTFLVRFSALGLIPVLAVLTLVATGLGRARSPRRAWVGLILLIPAAVVALDVGYLGHLWLAPLSRWSFESAPMRALQHAWPGLSLPLPVEYVFGFDRQILDSSRSVGYLLGRIYDGSRWDYYPLAFAFKWPLAFIGALALRVTTVRFRRDEVILAIPFALYFLMGAFAGLNVGIRYMLPILPPLCIALGGLAREGSRAAMRKTIPRLAGGLLLLNALETATCAPWYLSFFHRLAGGPGGGDRLLNDSNVDWGQGLIALREELRSRGIRRVHLAYHGTADPAIYGIDYVPYTGGVPGPESDWLAVSSFYFRGMSQRMMTPYGRTDFVKLDFHLLWSSPATARPARCMYLFPLPPNRFGSDGAQPVHP